MPRAPKRAAQPEKAIQKSILDYLKRKHIMHWRQNSGFAFMGNRMIRLGPAGLPDIFIVLDGRVIAMEVKTAIGKLRPAQEEFRDNWVANGGACVAYVIVRSLKDAQDFLEHGKA